jgi:hypothetical protein
MSIKRVKDRGRRNKGEDKDMIRRAVQIKRKLDVKGQKGLISSEGVTTKRRGVREQRYKSRSQSEGKNGNLPALFIVEFMPIFRELPEFMRGVDRRSPVISSSECAIACAHSHSLTRWQEPETKTYRNDKFSGHSPYSR